MEREESERRGREKRGREKSGSEASHQFASHHRLELGKDGVLTLLTLREVEHGERTLLLCRVHLRDTVPVVAQGPIH